MRTTSPIATLFGRSPIKPLQQHMQAAQQCAAEVILLFEALAAGENERLSEHRKKIDGFENRADEIKNEIRAHLPRSLFMPIDRRDFLDMLNAQDSIADTAQDIADLVVLRQMPIPATFGDTLQRYVVRSVDAVNQCRLVINEFDELLAVSFGGREAARVTEMVAELSRIESESDRLEEALERALFDAEDDMKPIDVVFWYRTLGLIGDLADYAEDVGDRLRLLIAR